MCIYRRCICRPGAQCHCACDSTVVCGEMSVHRKPFYSPMIYLCYDKLGLVRPALFCCLCEARPKGDRISVRGMLGQTRRNTILVWPVDLAGRKAESVVITLQKSEHEHREAERARRSDNSSLRHFLAACPPVEAASGRVAGLMSERGSQGEVPVACLLMSARKASVAQRRVGVQQLERTLPCRCLMSVAFDW
jgi:hypothetical protein